MIIISWNVNSVRARIENIKDYIKDTSPDVLLLQEIKTQNENNEVCLFPASNSFALQSNASVTLPKAVANLSA